MGWIKAPDTSDQCCDCKPAVCDNCECVLDCYAAGWSGDERPKVVWLGNTYWLLYSYGSNDCCWRTINYTCMESCWDIYTSGTGASFHVNLDHYTVGEWHGGEWYPIQDFEGDKYASGDPLELDPCGEYENLRGANTATVSTEVPAP